MSNVSAVFESLGQYDCSGGYKSAGAEDVLIDRFVQPAAPISNASSVGMEDFVSDTASDRARPWR